MRYVTWEGDNGLTVKFSGAGPWEGGGPYFFHRLTSPLGATEETFRAPRQDGVTTYHTSLNRREINLVGSMRIVGDATHPAKAAYDTARSWLCEAMSPDVWGTLTYHREDGPVCIRCRPVAAPSISAPVGVYSEIDVDFVSDSAYWEKETVEAVNIGLVQKFWHFPWAPVKGPMGAFNHFAGIENPTTRVIYPTVEIYSTGQEVTVKNVTTGLWVTIERPIGEDERLVVDLRDVTAWLWRKDEDGEYRRESDVSHWMSLDSEPWGLQPGYNQIVVSNDSPEDTPVAYVKYRLPVMGI